MSKRATAAWERLAQTVTEEKKRRSMLTAEESAEWDSAIDHLREIAGKGELDYFGFRCLVAEAMGIIGREPRTALEELYEIIEAEFNDGKESSRILKVGRTGKQGKDVSQDHFDLAMEIYLLHKRGKNGKSMLLKDAIKEVSELTGYSVGTLRDIWKANWKHVEAFIAEYGIPKYTLPRKL